MGLLILYLFASDIYERKILISNPAWNQEKDVQIRLRLDTRTLIAQSKLDPDGSSLRFFHKNNLIPCWIADTICTDSTEIWLKMDTLFPGEDSLTLFYTNEKKNNGSNFDSVFTKISVKPPDGWVFHCDEGEGNLSFLEGMSDSALLYSTAWSGRDGGGWGLRESQTFSSGSALKSSTGSFARTGFPLAPIKDSFTISLWLRLDTLSNLAYSPSPLVVAGIDGFFRLYIQNGNICFTFSNAQKQGTCIMAPFGWEKVGRPKVTGDYGPQGLAAIGNDLYLAVDVLNESPSQIWKINPKDMSRTDWFDMPSEAQHTSGLTYDSTTGILWASDFKSNMIYALNLHESFESHSANVIGKFSIHKDSISACCLATYHDTTRLLISTWGKDNYTYVVDEKASLSSGYTRILGRYKSVGLSQGLEFDGRYIWECGNSYLVKYDLEKAMAAEDYNAGIVSFYSEPLLPEDLAFFHDTLWVTTESSSKSFFRLTDDPSKSLGHWIFLCATYDGKRIKLYKNSILEDSMLVGPPRSPQNTNSSLYFCGQSTGNKSVEGIVDEIVLLPYAVDSNEIDAFFHRRKPLGQQPIVKIGPEERKITHDSIVNTLLQFPSITGKLNPYVLKVPYQTSMGIDLFDICGRKIGAVLPYQNVKESVELKWPQEISSGVYFLRIVTPGENTVRRIVFLK